MHPLAIEFDFVQSFRPVGRLVDHFNESRFDADRQRRRVGLRRARYLLV
jgi:hypothetical protein